MQQQWRVDARTAWVSNMSRSRATQQRKRAERGNTLPRFSAARGDRRGHFGASPQAALASRRGRRRGGSPRLAAQTADFFLRGRALDPAEAMQTVRLEPELEGDGAPARELARAGKFARAGLHTLQSLAQVSPLSCHEGKSSAGAGFTAVTLRVTSNDPGIVQKDTGYASMGRRLASVRPQEKA